VASLPADTDRTFLTVPVRSDLPVEEFLREHVRKLQPVVIRGALGRWKALQWTPEYLKQTAGSQVLHYRTEEGVRSGRWDDLIDLIFDSDRPAPYLRNIDLKAQLPALAHDIDPLPEYSASNWRSHFLMPARWPAEVKKDLYELFVSRTATAFPYLHMDYWGMSAFFAQLVGEKEVILFPREDAPYLYPTADPLVSSIKDFDNPDDARFPKFRQARQYRVTLRPGDLLYNPRWWHTTRTLKTSMTLIWAYWNKHEWDDLLHYVRTRVGRRWRPALVPYLRLVGLCNTLTE
jgi:histone arginine demethylase JMJD6